MTLSVAVGLVFASPRKLVNGPYEYCFLGSVSVLLEYVCVCVCSVI